MKQSILHVTLVVNDYDEALDFYINKLNFQLLEDIYQPEQNKRWVTIAPANSQGASILLAQASNEEQKVFVGNQTGGRVAFFLQTDNFNRDYELYCSRGIHFLEEPRYESYGTVVVFSDLYGNKWDLIELK